MPGQPTSWGTVQTLEVSSAAPGDLPVWVDISALMRPSFESAAGRQTELSSTEPGAATFELLNDGTLTTGNPSTIYPWWRQARRIRLRETVGYYTYDLFDGFIQRPRGQDRISEAAAVTIQDGVVFIAAVDLRGRLANARPFISTLGEHVRFKGGTALKGYWPLGDETLSWPDATGQQPPLAPYVIDGNNLIVSAQLQPASATLAADDLAVLKMTRVVPAGQLRLTTGTIAVTLDPGKVLTAVAWLNLDTTTTTAVFPATVLMTETPANTGFIRISYDPAANSITATLTTLGLTGTVTGSAATLAQALPVAVRYGFSPNVFELWVRDQVYTTTPGGTPPTTSTVTEVRFADLHNGLVGHAQWYIGDATDWTSAEMTAQYRMGWDALERQSTGDRINTIADYAGIPPSARDIDPGVAVMTAAALAGQLPGNELDRAAETEVGRLGVASNLLTFRDRRSTYDI